MPTPYYSDELVTLYHGSCLEILDWVKADALITDPPYGLGGDLSQSSGTKNLPTFGVQDWDDDLTVRDAALALWGSDKMSAVFGSPRRLAEAPPFRQAPLIWDKDGGGGMGDCSFPWRLTYELIFVNGRGWAGHRGESILRYRHSSRSANLVGHPTPKPLGLMSALIGKVPDGLVVADPFTGSGSTLLAARMLGYTSIGVELQEQYCEIAAGRLSQRLLDFGG